MCGATRDVRFGPKAGSCITAKRDRYSITSSARESNLGGTVRPWKYDASNPLHWAGVLGGYPMVRTITKKKKTIVDAAKSGLQKAKPIAGEALGAAAAAATDVVLTRVADALGQGQKEVEAATPMAKEKAESAARHVVKPAKRKRASIKKKAVATKRKSRHGSRGRGARRGVRGGGSRK
jgi:hypothetical protein